MQFLRILKFSSSLLARTLPTQGSSNSTHSVNSEKTGIVSRISNTHMHSYPLKIPLGHTYSLKLGQTVPSPAPTSPRQQQLKLDMDLLLFLRLYFKDRMSTLLKITYWVPTLLPAFHIAGQRTQRRIPALLPISCLTWSHDLFSRNDQALQLPQDLRSGGSSLFLPYLESHSGREL